MRISSYKNTKLLAIIVFFAILLSSDWCAGEVAEFPYQIEQNAECSIIMSEISAKSFLVYEQSIPVETCRGMTGQIISASERNIERYRKRYTDIAFTTFLCSVGTISSFNLLLEVGESMDLLECQILEFIHDSDGKKGAF